MRRMIPQSFADWIKKLKNKLFVNNSNKVEIDGNLVVDGEVAATSFEDVSDKVEVLQDLTALLKTAYKIGKTVVLCVRLKNETAASITSGTNILSLDSSIRSSITLNLYGNNGGSVVGCNIGQNGGIDVSGAIAVNGVITISLCYPIGD